MSDAALQVRRNAGKLAAFSRWEEGQAAADRPFQAVLADLGFVYSLLPLPDRVSDEDPTYQGIGKMHAALSVLSFRANA